MNKTKVFIEVGQKKAFAGAVDWPGWGRSSKDEPSALQALIDYGPRYAHVLANTYMELTPTASLSELEIVERHPGNATTDFGGFSARLVSDSTPVNSDYLAFFQAILQVSWAAFDRAVETAKGRELKKGPRGGGRDLEKMIAHVLESERAYLRKITGKFSPDPHAQLVDELVRMRQTILDSLSWAVTEGLPERGPRGGALWTPRYFVRSVCWHTLNHTWEIEDRLE